MASIFDPNKDKDAEAANGQAGAQPPANPQLISGQSATVGSGDSNTNKPTSSGRFTNIQNYMNANQAAPGQSMADKVGDKLGEVKQQNVSNFQTAQNDFNQQAGDARVQYNSGLVNNAVTNPNALITGLATGAPATPPASPVTAPISNAPPASVSPTPAAPATDLREFQRERDAQYAGPSELNNYSKLSQDAQNFQGLTQQTGSESGRFNLLRQFFNKPNYTRGAQSLDNLLMQGNGGDLNKLQGNRAQAAELNQNLQNTQGQAQQTADQYRQEANATRGQVRGQLSDAVTGLDNSLTQRANDTIANRTTDYNNLQSGITANEYNDQVAKLGLDKGTNLYDLNLNDFLTRNNPEVNNANVASADEYQRMQGLQQLSGDALDPNVAANFNKYNQTVQPTLGNDFTFDKDRFNTALGQSKDAYTNQASDIDNKIATQQQLMQWANQNAQRGGDYDSRMTNAVDTINDLLAQKNNLAKQYGQSSDSMRDQAMQGTSQFSTQKTQLSNQAGMISDALATGRPTTSNGQLIDGLGNPMFYGNQPITKANAQQIYANYQNQLNSMNQHSSYNLNQLADLGTGRSLMTKEDRDAQMAALNQLLGR